MDFDNDENLDYQLNKIASAIIREKRIKKGYSMDEVVKRLKNIVTKQSLSRYENNEARMKNKIFKKICVALGEDPAKVWEEINNKFLESLSEAKDTDPFRNEYDKQIEKKAIDLGGKILYIDKDRELTSDDVLNITKQLTEIVEKQKAKTNQNDK